MRVSAPLALGLLTGLALAAPQLSAAQSAVPLSFERVSFQVNVCLASQEEGEVDAECQSLQSKLPARFTKLELFQQERFDLTFGQSTDVSLPTGSRIQFLPISVIDQRLHMQIAMPGVVNARVQLLSGRPVILGGVRHGRGYLAVELRPTFVAPPPEPSRVVENARPSRPRPSVRVPEIRRVGTPRSR